MGIISRRINKRKNQEHATEQAFRTNHPPAVILERLRAYTEDENAEIRALTQSSKQGRLERWANDGKPRPVTQYYDLLVRGNEILVAYAWPVQGILAGQPFRHQGAWLARLTLVPVNASTTDIRILLLQWTVDGNNGRMQHQSWYDSLIGQFILKLPARAVFVPLKRP